MPQPPMNAMLMNSRVTAAPQVGHNGTGRMPPQQTAEQLPTPPSSAPPMGPMPGAGLSQGGRVDPALLAQLPPEFVDLLSQYGQLVDLDGDGTPDVAVVPLGNAMAQMGRGGQQNGPA